MSRRWDIAFEIGALNRRAAKLRRERLPHRQLRRVGPYTDSRAACIMALA